MLFFLLHTMIQKWNAQWKKLCRLFCLSELAVLKLIFYSYNSVSDLRFSLVVEQCNCKQVCCRKTIETTQIFSLSVSLLYHSEGVRLYLHSHADKELILLYYALDWLRPIWLKDAIFWKCMIACFGLHWHSVLKTCIQREKIERPKLARISSKNSKAD